MKQMYYWKKLTQREIRRKIAAALKTNIDFEASDCLGIPASSLDEQLFQYAQADEPLLQVYQQNPNHIGCHTMGDSEVFFHGTQALEKELIELLAVDMLGAERNSTDGYVAAGGTEANLQAIWVYRNYFLHEKGASHDEIALISSADTHYSIAKAANLLHLTSYNVAVGQRNRKISREVLRSTVEGAMREGKKYFIAVANMGTTMFGSVDDPSVYARMFREYDLPFFIHVDGAFGGFVYPVSMEEAHGTFANPDVSSITLDAHKMLQAPYGTGIFIMRKGLMHQVVTREAAYVHGYDITVSGSRSGANAVAVWLLLFSYGPFGWLEKINKLLYRTNWLCQQLDEQGIRYFREPGMNIVTIDAACVPFELVSRYGLVPDKHEGRADWYKIVVMNHVDLDVLNRFLQEMQEEKSDLLAAGR